MPQPPALTLGLLTAAAASGAVAFACQSCLCHLCRSGWTAAPGSAPPVPAPQLPFNRNQSLLGHLLAETPPPSPSQAWYNICNCRGWEMGTVPKIPEEQLWPASWESRHSYGLSLEFLVHLGCCNRIHSSGGLNSTYFSQLGRPEVQDHSTGWQTGLQKAIFSSQDAKGCSKVPFIRALNLLTKAPPHDVITSQSPCLPAPSHWQ